MINSMLRCAALLLAFGANAHAAFAPQKPVELVVHTGPGGGNDVLCGYEPGPRNGKRCVLRGLQSCDPRRAYARRCDGCEAMVCIRRA